MKHRDIADRAALVFSSAGSYLLLDLPARLTGFVGLSSFAGPKNFLPLLLGLLLGPWSVPGMCLGAAISGILSGSPGAEVAAELMSIPVFALGGRLLWYHKNARPLCLKQGRDYLRFFIAAAMASVAAVPALMLLGVSAWAELAISCGAYSVFVGIPILILITSILCIPPICPKGKARTPSVACRLSARSGGLDEANEGIETFCEAHGISMKRVLTVENCLEEFTLRIEAGCPDVPIDARLYISDSISLFLCFPGPRYNPLRRQTGEAEADLWGLMLIRQRALRASYRYTGGVNRLHIVI